MSLRNVALAGMIAPAMFALVVVVLTLLQYGFMVGSGGPLGVSEVPWPSGLALAPLGWVQVLNFVLFGFMLIAFAVGLHRGVRTDGRVSWVGPALLIIAGIGMVLAGFRTDPDISGGPQTWHGMINGLAFFLFFLPLLPAFFFLWWRLRTDPLCRNYDLYTLITRVLYVVLSFFPQQAVLYVWLAVILAWIEVTASRLRSVAEGASTQ